MTKTGIPYGKQNITEEDIKAVVDVLKSDYLTQGPRVQEFEENFASYVGSDFAVAVSNGTAALHLSLIGLGLKKGQKVITTPLSFAATANSVLYCGGELVFVDIDPETYLLDYQKVRALLENSSNGEFSGIITVDFAGRMCNHESFKELSDKYNLWYLSDSCHSPGGYFKDSCGDYILAGSNRYSDASIFSFHPVKHIAAGEGGIITTNDEELYNRLLLLRSHGIERRPGNFLSSISEAFGNYNVIDGDYPGWYMEMQQLGYNYRMPDILAALANSQLTRANDGIAARSSIAKFYTEFFEHKAYIHGLSGYVEGHAYHLYVIEVSRRNELYKHLKDHGIYCQIHYLPIYRMPFYKGQNKYTGLKLENVETYYSRCLSIPMFPTLELQDLKKITQLIDEFYAYE